MANISSTVIPRRRHRATSPDVVSRTPITAPANAASMHALPSVEWRDHAGLDRRRPETRAFAAASGSPRNLHPVVD
ncbi:hypothetical protein ABIA38_007251 [Embleya sp. AB8]